MSMGRTTPSGGGIVPSGGGTTASSGGIVVSGGGGPPSPMTSQAPVTHTRPAGQARPQPPQCSALVRVSTHWREHSVCPVGHGLARSSGGAMSPLGPRSSTTAFSLSTSVVLVLGRSVSPQAARRDRRRAKLSGRCMGR